MRPRCWVSFCGMLLATYIQPRKALHYAAGVKRAEGVCAGLAAAAGDAGALREQLAVRDAQLELLKVGLPFHTSCDLSSRRRCACL